MTGKNVGPLYIFQDTYYMQFQIFKKYFIYKYLGIIKKIIYRFLIFMDFFFYVLPATNPRQQKGKP
jgi:hypothetical protein